MPKDTFVEVLHADTLRRELRLSQRQNPEISFLDIKEDAIKFLGDKGPDRAVVMCRRMDTNVLLPHGWEILGTVWCRLARSQRMVVLQWKILFRGDLEGS